MLDRIRYSFSLIGVWFRYYLGRCLITFGKLFGVRLVRVLKPGD